MTESCVGFVNRNYNYNNAGNALGIALLQNPDLVAQDGNVAFQTSLWFWMTQGPHDQILAGSFSGTIKTINGEECGSSSPKVKDRVQNYQDICSTLGVDPGSDLYC
jgi:predicted chitinase